MGTRRGECAKSLLHEWCAVRQRSEVRSSSCLSGLLSVMRSNRLDKGDRLRHLPSEYSQLGELPPAP